MVMDTITPEAMAAYVASGKGLPAVSYVFGLFEYSWLYMSSRLHAAYAMTLCYCTCCTTICQHVQVASLLLMYEVDSAMVTG